jgi:hypothetical protein
MLATFAIGLASVFAFNGLLKYSDEIYVDLPKVNSDSIILVYPKCRFEIPPGGGSGPSWTAPKGYIPPKRITKCVENSSFKNQFNH